MEPSGVSTPSGTASNSRKRLSRGLPESSASSSTGRSSVRLRLRRSNGGGFQPGRAVDEELDGRPDVHLTSTQHCSPIVTRSESGFNPINMQRGKQTSGAQDLSQSFGLLGHFWESTIEHQPDHSTPLRSSLPPEDGIPGDVQKVVYYFAKSLQEIKNPENYTFVEDQPRKKMILKWMVFYSYRPRPGDDVDKPQRDELRRQLKLLPRFSTKLGHFLINKFRSFRTLGLITGDGESENFKYHAATQHWLRRSWDGKIERPQTSTQHAITKPSPKKSLKRPAPQNLLQRPRTRSRRFLSVESDVTIPTSTSGLLSESGPEEHSNAPSLPVSPPAVGDTARDQGQTGVFSSLQQIGRTSGEGGPREPVEVILKSALAITDASEGLDSSLVSQSDLSSLSPAPSLSPSASMSGNTTLHAPQTGHSEPDHLELVAKLQMVAAGDCQTEIQGFHSGSSASSAAPLWEELNSLMENEKSCKIELRDSKQELKVTQTAVKELCYNYDKLIEEFRSRREIIDKAHEYIKAPVPPIAAGSSEAAFAQSWQEARQTLANKNWLALKEMQRIELDEMMAKAREEKARLKELVTAKKTMLKEMRSKLEEYGLRDRSRKTNADAILDKMISARERFRSGTTSPEESDFETTDDELDDSGGGIAAVYIE